MRLLFSLEPPGSSAPTAVLIEGEATEGGSALDRPADLAYLDPPFASGYRYDMSRTLRCGSRTVVLRRPAFRDPFRGRPDEYVRFLAPCLAATIETLRPGGSLYVHLDWRVAAYVRVHLDTVLGHAALRNELVWRRNPPLGRKARAGQFGRVTDTILFYAKPGGPETFHPQTTTRPAARRDYRIDPQTGRAFRTAPRGDYTDDSIRRLEAEGRIHRTRRGGLRIRYDLEPGPPGEDGRPTWLERLPVDSLWTDIPDAMHVPPSERTGYPTQKPEALLARVVEASSNPGDLVFDPFCGSGTTLVAAARLGRRTAGADLAPAAVETAFGRLAGLGLPVHVLGSSDPPPPSPSLRAVADGPGRVRLESYAPPAVPDWPGAVNAAAEAAPFDGLPLLEGWGVAPHDDPGGAMRLSCWFTRDPQDGIVPWAANVPGLAGTSDEPRVLAWDVFGNRIVARVSRRA